jgi:eukaryotic-like serine/threonine-protein kinase
VQLHHLLRKRKSSVSASDRQPSFPPREGDVVAGKYVVDGIRGRGGMGVVVAATHLRLGTRVAIKVLSPQSLANPRHRERFLREAHAAARLRGEHVTRVLDIDDLRPGVPYLVLELLEGADLADVVTERGPLPPGDAAALVMQACEGLAEAHAAGIVHRDLKPSNLFLTKRPDGSPLVKLCDFGISKLREAGSPELALTGKDARLGSPEYMAPEQRRAAADVDARADIWSLGAVLYTLLAGRPPFAAERDVSLTARVATSPTPPIERDDVPAELEQVARRCLAKKPADRFASVAELGHALAPFAAEGSAAALRIERVLAAPRSEPIEARRDEVPRDDEPPLSGPVTVAVDDAAPTEASAPPAATRRPPTRHLRVVFVVAVVVLGVVSAIGLRSACSDRGAQVPPPE